MNILEKFAKEIIDGVGGLRDYERCELASPTIDRDQATVIWTLRCLANPECEGSQAVIEAILERRKKLELEAV